MEGVLAEIAQDLEGANQTQALLPHQPLPTRRHLGTTAQQAAPDPQPQEGDPLTPQGGEEAPEEQAEGDPQHRTTEAWRISNSRRGRGPS